jgi:hypothetical protein
MNTHIYRMEEEQPGKESEEEEQETQEDNTGGWDMEDWTQEGVLQLKENGPQCKSWEYKYKVKYKHRFSNTDKRKRTIAACLRIKENNENCIKDIICINFSVYLSSISNGENLTK